MALLVPKGIHLFPNSFEEAHGTIDVWYVQHSNTQTLKASSQADIILLSIFHLFIRLIAQVDHT
jgi:hypothetical protein